MEGILSRVPDMKDLADRVGRLEESSEELLTNFEDYREANDNNIKQLFKDADAIKKDYHEHIHDH